CVRHWREQAARVVHVEGESVRRRAIVDRLGTREMPADFVFVCRVLLSAVIRQQHQLVVRSQMPQQIIGTDFPTRVDREEFAGLYPQDAHAWWDLSKSSAIWSRTVRICAF